MSGWRKNQIADQVNKDNVVDLGAVLRAKLEKAIEDEERKKKILRPKYMTKQQIMDMHPLDVYMNIRTGEWAIEDFVAWVVVCENAAYIAGAEDTL